MTAVHTALAKRFPNPEWATFFEVRNDAGFRASRSADLVAMNTWPSRGLAVHGVEVKVSRSDWLRELADPEKSTAVQRFCDRWWLATLDDKIAKLEEIPELWGLLVLRGKSLVAVKEAPELKPEPFTRGFVAVLLRSANKGMVPASTIDEAVNKLVDERTKYLDKNHESERARMRDELNTLRKRVQDFERASGINLDNRYGRFNGLADPTVLGATVEAILSRSRGLNTETLRPLRNQLEGVLSSLDTVLETVRSLECTVELSTPPASAPTPTSSEASQGDRADI
jgi:hypothetical protein